MKRILTAMMILALTASAEAAVRRLAAVTVPEGETIDIDAKTAVAIRSANTTIATATDPADGRALLTGMRLGETELTLCDAKGPVATLPVKVVPTYWNTLVKFFEDDPEITIGISGDRVIVTGRTANIDTLRRVEQVKAFDTQRLVAQVSYSEAALAVLVQEYVRQCGYTNVTATVVGRDVCLAGRMYDKNAIKQLGDRVKAFLKDFPGVGVNTDALRIIKQKIRISIEFLSFDLEKTRNLGIKTPDAVTATGAFGWDWSLAREYGNTLADTVTGNDSSTTTYKSGTDGGTSVERTTTSGADSSRGRNHGRTSSFNTTASASISPVTVTLNMLKRNGCARSVYSTSLSTQSGEAARFQNGGTIHRNTQGTFSSDLKEIEYGFIINALPLIIDENTVNLDFELDNKEPVNAQTGEDITITRYQTKSKYVVRPGEPIVLSGFNNLTESLYRDGTPFLSRIPLLGWLFSNKEEASSKLEMLLVVTVDWELETDPAETLKRVQEFKDREIDVERP